jgi:hypothetical protein
LRGCTLTVHTTKKLPMVSLAAQPISHTWTLVLEKLRTYQSISSARDLTGTKFKLALTCFQKVLGEYPYAPAACASVPTGGV